MNVIKTESSRPRLQEKDDLLLNQVTQSKVEGSRLPQPERRESACCTFDSPRPKPPSRVPVLLEGESLKCSGPRTKSYVASF